MFSLSFPFTVSQWFKTAHVRQSSMFPAIWWMYRVRMANWIQCSRVRPESGVSGCDLRTESCVRTESSYPGCDLPGGGSAHIGQNHQVHSAHGVVHRVSHNCSRLVTGRGSYPPSSSLYPACVSPSPRFSRKVEGACEKICSWCVLVEAVSTT